MTEFAEKQGWHTDAALHFIDDRVTGAALERPALDRLRELVRCRAVDVLLVFSERPPDARDAAPDAAGR